MAAENRSQHISALGAKVIEIEKKTRQIEAEMKADVAMLNASGTRSEREMRKIKNNVLIDKQSVGVLNKTLRSLGMGMSAMAGAAKNSQTFFKEYAMAAEEFRLNKQNVAALAISSVAGAPIGYLASKIFETETVKNLMSNIKSKSGDMIRRALKRDKSRSGDEDFGEIPRMHSGGYVKKGGYAKLHAAEVVMPVEKLLKELAEQRKQNYANRKMTGTGNAPQSRMAQDIASIAKSTADTSKAIRTMSRGSHTLEKNMVAALSELKVAMIGTTDQWRIKMQSALLRHPMIRKFMTMTDMIKTFMSTPLMWLFGKRGGYEGAAAQAQKTDNVFEKSSNLLSLIFRYQMPRLDKIINLLQVGFEDKLNKKVMGAKTTALRKRFGSLKGRGDQGKDDEGNRVFTQAKIIKKWMEGKHKTSTMWERFVGSDYIGLGTDDLEAVGIGGFGDLAHPGKVTESLGITSENIKARRIQHSINALKHQLRFTKSEDKKKSIQERIKKLESHLVTLKKASTRKKKRQTKETPSMAAGGIIEKSGYIKAHAAEVIMPIEKFFNKFFGGKSQYDKNQAKINRTTKVEEFKEFGIYVGEGIAKFGKSHFGEKDPEQKRFDKEVRKRKTKDLKTTVKDRLEWLKFRKDTSKTLGTIKESTATQVKKTNEVVKELKEMGGGIFSGIGSMLSGITSMFGGMASTLLGSVASIGGGVLTALGMKKFGGKLGGVGKKVSGKAGAFKQGGFKSGFKIGAGVPKAIGAGTVGAMSLGSKAIGGVGKGVWNLGKSGVGAIGKLREAGAASGAGGVLSQAGKMGLNFAKKGVGFFGKGVGKGLATTAGATLGLGAGAIAGVGKAGFGIAKAARSGPLGALFTGWEVYDMMSQAQEMGVGKGAAGIAGLLTAEKEGGVQNAMWGVLKGAGLGAMIGGPIGAVVGGAAIGAMSYFGGEKVAKAIDEAVTKTTDYLGTIGPEGGGFDYNENPWELEREHGGGLGSFLTKIFNPDAGLTAAEQIDKLKARLKSDPNMLPTQKREIEEKIASLEMTTRGQKYSSRFYDPKEGKETKTYEMNDIEKFLGIPLVSEKDRKPTTINREDIRSPKVTEMDTNGKGGKQLRDQMSETEAERAKQIKDMGKDIVQPMVESMDMAQKNMDKNNKMLANTIINSSNVISNTINNSSSSSGGGQGGFGFGAGSVDLNRLLQANVS